MALKLGDGFPNFTADTTIGKIDFYEWLGNSWGILFSHPADYTPVCTTELARVLKYIPRLRDRNVKFIALSVDPVETHTGWKQDIQSYAEENIHSELPFPIIADPTREISIRLGMLDPEEKDKDGMPLTCRALFIVGPDQKMKLCTLYPASTGRSLDEVIRVIDSLQLASKKKIATPADWKPGDPIMIDPTLSPAEINEEFPGAELTTVSMPSGKNYLRHVLL